MITIRKISAAEAEQLGLRRLYEDAFPVEERREWSRLSALPSEFVMHALVGSDGRVVGLANLWMFDSMTYVEHLAVSPACRGAGVGSDALRAIREATPGLPVILEVEPAGSTPDAARRIAFYRRNGFVDFAGYRYVQPPYDPGLPSVPLTLMSTDAAIDLDAAVHLLHSRVYGIKQ